MHELGHNLWLRHANKNGMDSGDDTAAMGACCATRCHNAAHAWQLGWVGELARVRASSLPRGQSVRYTLPVMYGGSGSSGSSSSSVPRPSVLALDIDISTNKQDGSIINASEEMHDDDGGEVGSSTLPSKPTMQQNGEPHFRQYTLSL